MNQPNWDNMTLAEIKQFRKFVNLDLRRILKRKMPDEMVEIMEQDIVEKLK